MIDLAARKGLFSREVSQVPSQVPSRERERDPWSYVSPSRLNLWLRCPLAFRLRYVDGIESPMSTAQFLGRRVHAALEHYYRHRQLEMPPDSGAVIAHLHARWDETAAADRMQFASTAEAHTCRTQAADLVRVYLSSLSPIETKPLAVETQLQAPLCDPVTGEDLGIPLLGIVDLILDDQPGPTIVDFKTASRGGDTAENLHEIQLSCYAYLFRHATGVAENALEIRSLIKTKLPKVETHRFAARSPIHLRRLFAVIRAYLDDLDRGRFVMRPSLLCSSCEFRERHCQTWDGS